MIDLHMHILPGLDDGPDTVAASVAVAEVAYHGGTRTAVATPHLRPDHPDVRAGELAERTAELQDELTGRGVALKLLPGAEVDLDSADALSDGELAAATLAGNGRDLLVETPYGPVDSDFADRLRALAGRGFRLTLAHPERNAAVRDRPELLGGLVADGVLVQITARAVTREGASAAAAVDYLKRGWCHVLASDAHALNLRPPDLGVAVHRIATKFPELEAELRWMVTDAPGAIVAGAELPPRPERAPAPRRRLLFRR